MTDDTVGLERCEILECDKFHKYSYIRTEVTASLMKH